MCNIALARDSWLFGYALCRKTDVLSFAAARSQYDDRRSCPAAGSHSTSALRHRRQLGEAPEDAIYRVPHK